MRKPAIFAHRAGPDGRFQENSIAACDASMKLGVDGIEIDVRRTRDGIYVVTHDPEVPGLGPIDELDYGKLRRVPTLDEFLPHATRGAVFLDVKLPYPARELVRIARAHLPEDRIIFGSFWHPFIRDAKKAAPRIRGAITLEARLVDPVRAARDARADILAVNERFIDPDTVRRAHRAGIEIYPWTVNDPNELRRLHSLRVDALITDHPSRLIPTRGASGAPAR
jgi:glycerophosphoryl diester phosphodiesterase